jgi:hypothetical protein
MLAKASHRLIELEQEINKKAGEPPLMWEQKWGRQNFQPKSNWKLLQWHQLRRA